MYVFMVVSKLMLVIVIRFSSNAIVHGFFSVKLCLSFISKYLAKVFPTSPPKISGLFQDRSIALSFSFFLIFLSFLSFFLSFLQ